MRAKRQVFIVDDHPIFRRGLREILESDPALKVVGEASDGGEALGQIKTQRPDAAVVDIGLPGLGGLELARALAALSPPVAVVILTMHREEKVVNAALDLGVKGYVVKENATGEIVNAVHAVIAGEVYLSPSISGYLLRRAERARTLRQEVKGLATLTPMERMVLRLLAENLSSREIAKRLFLSPRTVETHGANICGKLDLHGLNRLLQFALEHKAEL